MSSTPDRIYLDHNATTPTLPQVVEAVARAYANGLGNPASQHEAGRRARQVLEDAREAIAAILGAAPQDRLIFTSGGTEANNLAILGLAGTQPAHAIVSPIEHPSVAGPCEHLRQQGWEIDMLGVSTAGVVDVENLEDLLRPQTRLVSIMLANNETGVLQPVARAAAVCAARGVPLHTDAVQVAGKLPIDFRALGVTALTLSAHKFHGPPGSGALLLRPEAALTPQLHGGFQQGAMRPGTEPVALAAGMRVALESWHAEREEIRRHTSALRAALEAGIRDGFPDLVVNGAAAERLPHTSNLSFPGLDRQALVMALDLAGVACSTGSACASGSSEPSGTLVAMGCRRDLWESAVRFSLGRHTTAPEVAEGVRRIVKICNSLRTENLGQKNGFGGRRAGSILVD